MLHQLVTNLVCLPFGAGQVVHNGFIRDFSENSCLLWLSKGVDECFESKQQSHSHETQNNELEDVETLRKSWYVNSLWVHHYESSVIIIS